MYFSMWIEPTIIASQVKIMNNSCLYDTATGWLLINNHSVLSNFPPRPYILGHCLNTSFWDGWTPRGMQTPGDLVM